MSAPTKVLAQIRAQLRTAEIAALQRYLNPQTPRQPAHDDWLAAMNARLDFECYCMPVSLLAEVVAGENA